MSKLVNSEYFQINLSELVDQIGESDTKCILSSFVCDKNKEVEGFIKDKTVLFSAQGIAKTHLVFWSSSDESWGGQAKELVGYYSIALKTITIKKGTMSNNKWRRVCKHGDCISIPGECKMPALLIGQLAKNYHNGNDALIWGSDLLNLAIEKLRKVQAEVGGRIVYLECEDAPGLIKFYNDNGFTVFGKRKLDGDETDLKGEYLIQLFRYL